MQLEFNCLLNLVTLKFLFSWLFWSQINFLVYIISDKTSLQKLTREIAVVYLSQIQPWLLKMMSIWIIKTCIVDHLNSNMWPFVAHSLSFLSNFKLSYPSKYRLNRKKKEEKKETQTKEYPPGRKTQWAVPPQACESWPIRGDWSFQEGGLKETST